MPHTTVYTIWIKDLNLTPETIKPLEENRRENLQNIDLDNDFLDLITKARHLKQKCVPSGSAVKKKKNPSATQETGRSCGFIPWVRKDLLEEEIAAHCSILAWKITWTEEPVNHIPWGHKRVRQDLETK